MLPGITGSIMAGLGSQIPAGTLIISDNPQSDGSNDTSYTFSIDGEDAQSNRRIWAMIHWAEGGSHRMISSVTINGVAASGTQAGHSGGLTGFGAGLYSAAVPTGEGAMNVVVTFDGIAQGCLVDTIIGYGFAAAAHDTDTDQTAVTSGNVEVLIDTAANGIIIAAFSGSSNTAGDRVTWIGVTELNDADTGVGGTYSTGTKTGTSSASGVQVTAQVAAHADAGNALVVETRGLA
jgi:hypothetical protein